MRPYGRIWDFYRDSTSLIADGATLRDLYEAYRSVPPPVDGEWSPSARNIHSLATGWSQSPDFVPIRLRELFEGYRVAHDDDYILAMVGHLGGRWEQDVRLHMLRHDAELRDTLLWRIFEVEGGGQISLANVDKYSDTELNWHTTIALLAEEGTISRARVLRSCLEALNRDFSSYRAGWFSKLFTALAPTPAEASSNEDLLRRCLGSSTTATIALSARYLGMIHNQARLDVPEFVSACAPALVGPKTAAMTVLRILRSAALSDSAPIDAIVASTTFGLAHPHADVQRAAAELLVQLDRIEIVEGAADSLAPAVVAATLPQPGLRGSTPDLEATGSVPAQIPTATPVIPWTDDDAQERFSTLLEFGADAIELELALAWLASTTRATTILAPMLERARKVAPENDRFWIASLVRTAVEPTIPFLPQPTWQHTRFVVLNGRTVARAVGAPEPLATAEERTVLPSLVTRLREVAAILQGTSPRRRLLATPIDTHGRIEPEVLLGRFRAGPAPFPADLAQAILRIPPTERNKVADAMHAVSPAVTSTIRVEWRSIGTREYPQWTPDIRADEASDPSPIDPALIPWSKEERHKRSPRSTSAIVASALGLIDPASTLPLVAIALPILNRARSEVDHAAGPILHALAEHPAPWQSETAQVVALGLAALDRAFRTQSAELLAAAIPARISATAAADGFAACAPVIALGRWAQSLTDAATLAPIAVIELLTHLLPQLDRRIHGIGALISVLVDESIRAHRTAHDAQLREWLEGFSGSSGAAKAARTALAIE